MFGRIRPHHVLLSISNGKKIDLKTSFDRPPLDYKIGLLVEAARALPV
jgi:hypothetical protein